MAQHRMVRRDGRGRAVATDSEGYLLDLADWSEDFARAWREEGLTLTPAHWELIHFLRAHYWQARRAGPGARDDPPLQRSLGAERGSNHHLHEMFPMGGPQKQGNRLAGLLRTKGEH
jgi:tRNA 2-thiouridine synthesizing protein E